MRIAILALILAMLASTLAAAQSPDKPPRCNLFSLTEPSNLQSAVEGCTYWIESGKLDRPSEAKARMFRLIARQNIAEAPPAEVLAEIDKIIELDPRDRFAYSLRIESLRKLGQYERALQEVATKSALFPDDTTSLNERSVIYSELGDHDRAISEARTAINRAPRDWSTYHTLVTVCIAASRAGEALADIDSGLALMKSPLLSALRSRVLRTAGRLEEAHAAYEAAIQFYPRDEEFKKQMKQLSGEP